MSQLITITHQPPKFSPVYTDGLFFTIIAPDFSFPKFRYTYEVYVNNEVIFNGKCTPNPFGLGVVDVSGILKNYVTNLPLSYFENTPIYTHETFPFSRPLEDHVILYNVKFGYEYALDEVSEVLQYNGFGTIDIDVETGVITITSDLGLPSADTGPFKTYHATMGTNGRATQQDFDMGPFILSGTPINTQPTTTGLFLTNSPRIRDIQLDEYYTLGFTNYYLDNANTLSQPYYAEYTFYNENGNVIDIRRYLNTYPNGGGPLTDCSSVYQSLFTVIPKTDTEYNTLYLGVGPKNIIQFPEDTVNYTVQLFGNFTGTTSPPSPTPTPTPTVTPSPFQCNNCLTYNITNSSPFTSALYSFVDCETSQFQSNILPPNGNFQFCACEGTFQEETSVLLIAIGGGCGPKPCDDCETVTVFNNNTESNVVAEFWNCELGPNGSWDQKVLQAQSGSQFCACFGSFNMVEGMEIQQGEPCGTPAPTPTPTPPCEFLSHKVRVCNGMTCSNGLCRCISIGQIFVYTDCNTPTPFEIGARVWVDTDLTQRFVGRISNGVVVFDVIADPMSNQSISTFECLINGPC